MPDSAWLILAALGAGILNTIAGGGTFLTFPALVFIGVPPVMANATSAVAVFPGYLGGALGFRKELQVFDRPTLLRLVVITLAGGLAGSLLLLVSSNEAFSLVVPFLQLAATLVFLGGEAQPLRHPVRLRGPSCDQRLRRILQRWTRDRVAGAVRALGHDEHSRDERPQDRVVLCVVGNFRGDLCRGRDRCLATGDHHDGRLDGGWIPRRSDRTSPANKGGEGDCRRCWVRDEPDLLCAAGALTSRRPGRDP